MAKNQEWLWGLSESRDQISKKKSLQKYYDESNGFHRYDGIKRVQSMQKPHDSACYFSHFDRMQTGAHIPAHATSNTHPTQWTHEPGEIRCAILKE